MTHIIDYGENVEYLYQLRSPDEEFLHHALLDGLGLGEAGF
ncbi:hypothetical protein [Leptolyngbya sp. BC1307]|nr:hypothetical protein [Leptolyngbya sp. BC1307]